MNQFSDFALSILRERCFLKNDKGEPVESAEEMFRRVARVVAKAEKTNKLQRKWEKIYYDMMISLDFLPGSPTLFNAGKKRQLLSSCFVIPLGDSMNEIFGRLSEIATIQKFGGGTGMSFSSIRPKGDMVSSTHGVASGPVAFMAAFNGVTDSVKQGGMRRGANMGILKVDHPDIMEFITCKDEEGKLTNFNISVALTDEFMELVQEDGILTMRNPRNNRTQGTVRAKQLFSAIVAQMWKNGEPGVVFIDVINKKHAIIKDGIIESTNPCIEENELVRMTSEWKPVKNVKVGEYVVGHDGKQHRVYNVIDQGIKEMVKVYFDNGITAKCTPDHKFIVDGQKIPAHELKHGQPVSKEISSIKIPDIFEWGLLDGYIYGDGSTGDRIQFSADKIEDAQLICRLLNAQFGCEVEPQECKSRSGKSIYHVTTGKGRAVQHYKGFNISDVKNKEKSYQEGFLAGWYNSDGHCESNNGYKQICLTIGEKNQDGLREIWYILLNFGIISKTYYVKRKGHHSDEKYGIKNSSNSHRICVGGESYNILADIIGWDLKTTKSYKKESLVKVKKIEDAGKGHVYDLTVEGCHSFTLNGFAVANCGEQPLLPYESCNLGSINLANMIKNGMLDDEKLIETTYNAVRLLDAVIDVNVYPLDKIEKATKANRKIGLGVMGWHDFLIEVGVPYDSQSAVEYIHEIMELVSSVAFQASQDIGEEKGTFPNVVNSKYAGTKKPPRNAERITIAPTGTISSIAGVSSGIEPHYALHYRKRVLDDEFEITVAGLKPYLKQYEISWKDVKKNDGTLRGIGVPLNVKKLFSTALEIPMRWHVKHQAIFQQYVDAAVSKTINMSNNTSKEDISKTVIHAWKEGCKGMTLYRDGSRDEQVLSTRGKITLPSKRPDTISAKVVKVETGCGSMYVTVGIVEGQIYEVLTSMGKAGGCQNAMLESICRLISIARRSGVPVEEILDQIESIRCPHPKTAVDSQGRPVLSCPDAVAKAIRSQLDANIKMKPEIIATCPRCGEKVIFLEGCERCSVCPWSRC